MGIRGYFPWVKRSRSEVNHSPRSSAEVKDKWSYTSTPPICLHGLDREHFTFYLTLYLDGNRGSELQNQHLLCIQN